MSPANRRRRAKVNITEEAIKTWFEAHKLNYKTAPQAKLAYLSFVFADFSKPDAVSEEALRAYYQDHLAVITSYSIHYTKLYDPEPNIPGPCPGYKWPPRDFAAVFPRHSGA